MKSIEKRFVLADTYIEYCELKVLYTDYDIFCWMEEKSAYQCGHVLIDKRNIPKFNIGDTVKIIGYQDNAPSMQEHVGRNYEINMITVRGMKRNWYNLKYNLKTDVRDKPRFISFSWREDWLTAIDLIKFSNEDFLI